MSGPIGQHHSAARAVELSFTPWSSLIHSRGRTVVPTLPTGGREHDHGRFARSRVARDRRLSDRVPSDGEEGFLRFLRIKPLLVIAAVLATAVIMLARSSAVSEQPASAQPSHSGQLAASATSGSSGLLS